MESRNEMLTAGTDTKSYHANPWHMLDEDSYQICRKIGDGVCQLPTT